MSPAGYSGTPLWKKLGLRDGRRLLTSDAPRGWSLPEPPDGVAVVKLTRSDRGDVVATAFFGPDGKASLNASRP